MTRTLSLILLLVLCAGVAAAQVDGKNTIVSVGSYVINWTVGDEDTNFQGFTLGGTIALSPSLALRGGFYTTENEDESSYKIKGLEGQVLLGSNLNGVGFKIYGLGGYFKDTNEMEFLGETLEEDFTGLMLGGGLGYNWNGVALDFSIAWRQDDDYTDGDASKSTEPDVTMMSGALSLGLRF